MNKIKPMQEQTMEESKRTYNDLFSNVSYYIDEKLKARGIHDLILHMFRENIKNSKVLDIGCGYGRFSFLASTLSSDVLGIDMTEGAISVANKIKKSLDNENVKFICSSIEDFSSEEKFDFIILSGTLEHIHDEDDILKKINYLLSEDGVFVTDSPSEFNFRGLFHASLWKLFNFPMTLSDVRIITPKGMREMAINSGFKLDKIIGTLYKRGWGEAGASDIKSRMKNVMRSVSENMKNITISHDNYNNWIDEALDVFNPILEDWKKNNILKEIPNIESYGFKINREYLKSEDLPSDKIEEYMAPDFSIDPYYCDSEPYNQLGGNNIYVLTKK